MARRVAAGGRSPRPSTSTTTARRAGAGPEPRLRPVGRRATAERAGDAPGGRRRARPRAYAASGQAGAAVAGRAGHGRRATRRVAAESACAKDIACCEAVLAVGGRRDAQGDVVAGDGALVAVVGVAVGLAAGGGEQVDPADGAPAEGEGELAAQRPGT